jgi:hypothetical protein
VFFSRPLAARIRRNWKKWGWWRTFAVTAVLRLCYMNNTGSYVLDEKWDNLIILDACRFDTFQRVTASFPLDGKLESRVSRGADTTSFLVQNFRERDCMDIVYVSANPQVPLVAGGSFFKIIPVWKENLWPQTVYRQTLDALDQFPDKRFIIHFLQPHHPYLGIKINMKSGRRYTDLLGVFTAGAYTMIEKGSQVALYERNLRIVLPYVRNLLERLPGRTVVTADHGEAFGERIGLLRLYGHGAGARIPALVRVPWLVAQNNKLSREKVIAGRQGVEKLDARDEEDIRKRLVDLGYE